MKSRLALCASRDLFLVVDGRCPSGRRSRPDGRRWRGTRHRPRPPARRAERGVRGGGGRMPPHAARRSRAADLPGGVAARQTQAGTQCPSIHATGVVDGARSAPPALAFGGYAAEGKPSARRSRALGAADEQSFRRSRTAASRTIKMKKGRSNNERSTSL